MRFKRSFLVFVVSFTGIDATVMAQKIVESDNFNKEGFLSSMNRLPSNS